MVSTTSTPTPTTQTTSSSSFYLLRNDPPATTSSDTTTGSENLLVHHGLEQVYQKFCSKKVKESLSAFLPHVPGYIDEKGNPDNSLRSVIDKPPIGGKELLPLPTHALSGFRLNPGPIPEQFRFVNQQPVKKKHKHKKHRSQETDIKTPIDSTIAPSKAETSHDSKKHKKQKKHEDGERKKKKKEKKKKKRHTPEPVPPKGLPMGGV
ncbi:mediator of RNA polymerase II transcription subunit 19-like [Actinia tenebrosa]|uniref:Mediator of RNA polymerase II transcription subunit 19 n=1 Tax=Actinia tenebrosa TaxID=6105 RepID=A0A6P8HMG8_ACTTE|nr:mediator of RNA polymerase II transcription subunit 19-like [Actinia tenebrosa]